MADKLLNFQFDNVEVDLASCKVWKGGTPLALEPKAFEVLVFFLHHPGRLIEKNELLDAIWGESFVTPNALTRVIAQLRKSLGDDAKEARYIETVPTRGYRFIAEAKQIAAEPVRQPPADNASPAMNARRPMHPRWLWAGLAGFAVIGLLIFWRANRTQPDWGAKAGVRKTVQITSSVLMDLYPAFSPDGAALAYSSIRNGSFEIFVQPLTPGSREVQVTSDGAQNLQPTWSPDGKRIAFYSRERKGIWIVPAFGGVAQQVTEFGAEPSWSPDGKWIVFQSDAPTDIAQNAFTAILPSTLWIVPAAGGTPKRITQRNQPNGGHGAPSWSPDGKRIVFTANLIGRSQLYTVTPEGKELEPLTKCDTSYFDPVFAPDGNALFVATAGGNFQLWRLPLSPETGLPAGEPEEVANTGAALARYLTISPDGKRLAYSSLMMANNLGSVAIAPETGEAIGAPILLTQDTNKRKTSPSFAPDGKTIAYSLWRAGAGGELWLMDADGNHPRQLTAGLAGLPNWMPDGKQVAVVAHGGATLRLQGINIETQKQSFLSEQVFPFALGKLSPDGKLFAFNSTTDGIINLATLPVAGGSAKQLTHDQELLGFPCWSRDGQWIVGEMKRGEDTHLVILPREGGALEQITSTPGQSWPGSWAADNDRIAFAGQRNGIWNVYWVSRKTRVQKQVTNYTKPNLYVRYPAWSPLSNQIVYEFAETTGNVWLMELK
ncbi:MAG: winged helix-turn-helix domain-containing protein [Blastocatellia bacterium]